MTGLRPMKRDNIYLNHESVSRSTKAGNNRKRNVAKVFVFNLLICLFVYHPFSGFSLSKSFRKGSCVTFVMPPYRDELAGAGRGSTLTSCNSGLLSE